MHAHNLIHFLVTALFVLLSGCARLNNVLDVETLDPSLKMATYSGDLQNTLIKKTAKGTRTCTQPDPDSSQSYSDGLEVSAGVGPAEGVKDSVGGSSLGGRNPAVLITRELMFRACELGLNYDVKYHEARKIYREFLKAAVEMTSKQVGTGSAAVASVVSSEQSISNSEESDSDSDEENPSSSKN